MGSFCSDCAVYLLQNHIQTLNNSLHTQMTPHVLGMSLDLLWILCGLQLSGWARTCSVRLSWPGPPCFTPTEGNNCNGTACKEISTFAHFIFVSSSICGSTCREGNFLSLSEQSSGNMELIWCEFFVLLFFEPLGFGCRVKSSSQGENQGNGNHYLINQAPRKERIVQHLVLSPPLFVLTVSFCSSLFFMTCSQPQQGRSSLRWTSRGSSGPSKSSRRCPASSGAAA